MTSNETSSTVGTAPGHWQIAQGDAAEAAWAARLHLAGDFWYPVYAFLRAGPCAHAEAAAHGTESLLAEFVEEPPDSALRNRKPLLRNHLLAAVSEAAEHPAERPPATVIDRSWAEKRFAKEPAKSPAEIYLRAWALIVVELTLADLRAEYGPEQKRGAFEVFQPFLAYTSGGDEAYETAGRQLGTSSGAARKAVYEFRHRYRQLLRAQVAQTVMAEDQIDPELGALLSSV